MKDRLLLVEDAIAALQTLAHRVYEAWDKPVVAITGSAGKTTAKELTAHLLQARRKASLEKREELQQRFGIALVSLAAW